MFNEKGEFIKSIDVNIDFAKSISTFENWLRREKVYAHRADSFTDRGVAWYDMSLPDQLLNLCWEFDKKGKLVGTAW